MKRFSITTREILSIGKNVIFGLQLIIFGYMLGIIEFGRLCHEVAMPWENPCRLMGGPAYALLQVGILFFMLLVLRILIEKWEKKK